MNGARVRNTLIVVLVAIVIFGVSVVLIWVGTLGTEWYHSVATQIGTAVLVAAGLGVLWDAWGRRLLADEIYEKLKVGQAVSRWGIKDLSLTWNEQPWPLLFAKGSNVDVMLGYGQTWRGVAHSGLEEFLADRKNTLRVCLPDPHLEWVMQSLAHRYNTTPAKLREKVLEAARYFADLRDAGEATVQIFFRAGQPLYALYRFESVALVTLYPHRKERSSKVPAMTMETGEMVEWLKHDFEAAIRDAREVADDEFRDDPAKQGADSATGGSAA